MILIVDYRFDTANVGDSPSRNKYRHTRILSLAYVIFNSDRTMYERKTPVDLDCPLRLTMSLIDSKWKSCILDELPPRSEYAITPLGMTLVPIIDAMMA